MRTTSNDGFTLIELLVVVLIIGILAAIALPQYNKAVEKSRLAEALTILSTMEKQLDLYVLANGYAKSNTSTDYLVYQDIADVEVPGEIDQYGRIVTSNFRYDSGCGAISCGVEVYNTKNTYGLRTSRSSDETTWERECWDLSTDMGKYICESLVSQGWIHQAGEY